MPFDGEDRVFRYRFGINSREVTEESLMEVRPVTNRVFFSRRRSGGTGEDRFDLSWWDRRGFSNDDSHLPSKSWRKGRVPTNCFFMKQWIETLNC